VFLFGRTAIKYDWVVCGLGNFERKYADTRHNLGFWVVDALSERWGASRPYQKCQGEMRDARVGGSQCALVKPQTYMNGSGLCVGPLMRRNRDAKLLVVFDDVSLPLGRIRLRLGGSAGGHKGVDSVIRHYGADFYRVKLGIGGADLEYLSDYVLDGFEPEELQIAMDMVAKAVLKVCEIVVDGWDKAATGGIGDSMGNGHDILDQS
jgi:PTH1 family peptidyl-tRNA hydrolase